MMSTTYTETKDTALDFSDYTLSDIAEVSRMLELWLKDKWGKNAQRQFNTRSHPKIDRNQDSDTVYMIDGDYNTVILLDDKLQLWVTCPECGTEGAESDFVPDDNCDQCVKTKRSLL